MSKLLHNVEEFPNYTSQRGEDRLLQALFGMIGVTNKWCVEFGAADGKHRSNTWYWINKAGWSSVQIEAARDRNLSLRTPWHDSFEALQARYKDNPQVTCVNQLVGASGNRALDVILAKTAIPKDFDLLSMDVDGSEYDIWQAMQEYTPRVAVIEHDKTIPIEVSFHSSCGSSLRALTELGKTKGYELVAANDLNGIFVRRELCGSLDVLNNQPEKLWLGQGLYRMSAQMSQAGKLLFAGPHRVRWVRGVDGTISGQLRAGKYVWLKPGETTMVAQAPLPKMPVYGSGWLRHWWYQLSGKE